MLIPALPPPMITTVWWIARPSAWGVEPSRESASHICPLVLYVAASQPLSAGLPNGPKSCPARDLCPIVWLRGHFRGVFPWYSPPTPGLAEFASPSAARLKCGRGGRVFRLRLRRRACTDLPFHWIGRDSVTGPHRAGGSEPAQVTAIVTAANWMRNAAIVSAWNSSWNPNQPA